MRTGRAWRIQSALPARDTRLLPWRVAVLFPPKVGQLTTKHDAQGSTLRVELILGIVESRLQLIEFPNLLRPSHPALGRSWDAGRSRCRLISSINLLVVTGTSVAPRTDAMTPACIAAGVPGTARVTRRMMTSEKAAPAMTTVGQSTDQQDGNCKQEASHTQSSKTGTNAPTRVGYSMAAP